MIVDVRVPALAESVPDAKLLAWKFTPGDRVSRGDVLIELETDKVVLEVPAPETGVLAEVVLAEGETAESEQLIARIDTAGAGDAPATAAPREAEADAPGPETSRPLASIAMGPAARRLVAEHRIDPGAVTGSGKGGRLTKADVHRHLAEVAPQAEPAYPTRSGEPAAAFAANPVPSPPQTEPARRAGAAIQAEAAPPPPRESEPSREGSRAERREPMSRLRRRIAERLIEAQHSAAILTTFNEVDMQPVMELRRRYRDAFERRHGVRLGFMSFFVRAAVQALRRYPLVNAFIDGDDIVQHDYCDIGVAVGSPRGLVVPVLRNAEGLSFAAVERAIADFGARARDGTLGLEELTGGTFTISNGGVFGSLLSTPILNPPQSAILGMHKTQPRPVADENGAVTVRPMMYLALSYDHRIIDGREAVRFLVAIKEAVEDPARLLLEV